MSVQQGKKPNNNPTFGIQGADIPVLIYLNNKELAAIGELAKMLHHNFKAQSQKFLKTPDIREFVKFATLTYYNMVVLQIQEQEKQKKAKQNVVRKPLVNLVNEDDGQEPSEYTKYV